MRLRHEKGAEEKIAGSRFVVQEPEKLKGRWHEYFGNANPIRIEVGMGKGRFIMELARQNPGINYIGIERYSTVLLKALKKREELELGNVCFLRIDALTLADVFGEGEIDRIYLNFSDPWPKDRHAKRRLTSERFLPVYDKILKEDGRLEFKTDNQDLFAYSLESIPACGWRIDAKTFDLHHDAMAEGNVMTEYEMKFAAAGKPICKLIASREKSGMIAE